MSPQKLSIITPIYRQEKVLKTCIEQQLSVLEKIGNEFGIDYELIAVVDGEVDNSKKILEELNSKNLKIISYKDNRGKGYAVRTGMASASSDLIGYIDAGLDLDPKVLILMVKEMLENKSVSIVVGSKKHKDSKLVYPLKRKLFTKGYSLLVRLLFGMNYEDTQVGVKLYRKELVKKIIEKLTIDRYAFEIEMLYVAHLLGYTRHIDVPVSINFNSDFSSVSNLRQIFKMFRDTLNVFWKYRIRGRSKKILLKLSTHET